MLRNVYFFIKREFQGSFQGNLPYEWVVVIVINVTMSSVIKQNLWNEEILIFEYIQNCALARMLPGTQGEILTLWFLSVQDDLCDYMIGLVEDDEAALIAGEVWPYTLMLSYRYNRILDFRTFLFGYSIIALF